MNNRQGQEKITLGDLESLTEKAVCEHCGNEGSEDIYGRVTNPTLYQDQEGNNVCEECLRELVVRCSCCSAVIWKTDLNNDGNGNYFCEVCKASAELNGTIKPFSELEDLEDVSIEFERDLEEALHNRLDKYQKESNIKESDDDYEDFISIDSSTTFMSIQIGFTLVEIDLEDKLEVSGEAICTANQFIKDTDLYVNMVADKIFETYKNQLQEEKLNEV